MSKTLATTHGINLAAFDLANKRLSALRKIKDQATLIEELEKKFNREKLRNIEYLSALRKEAEEIGAYEMIAPAATVVAS